MAITEGTYLIINVNSKLAMDVANASDAWGANILLWSPHSGDSQIWAVTQHDNGWQLICSLTGKSADVENGKVNIDGTNVRQWDDNNANCQRWDFVETGETETYNGKSYATYAIKAHGTNRCLDAANGGTSPGTNVLLYTYNSQKWQKWFLVPVSCFTDEGTYAIRSALDTNLCVDIANGSNGAGAKALVWPYHGNNNEVFQTVRNADSLTVKIVAAHSGKALDVDHGATENGRQILQWPIEANNANQEWLPVQAGSITVNGVTVPTYELRNQSSQAVIRVIDIYGGSKTPGTNLVVWERNGQPNQRFWFDKVEMLGAGISTPTQAQPQLVQANGPVTFNLSFDCDEEYYQARYRVRTYSGKDRQKYTQTDWMNVKDGSKTNDGWGPAWTYSFTREELENDGVLTLPRDFTLDVDGATEGKAYAEVGLQVRAYREEYGALNAHAHGQTASTTVKIAKNPTITLDDLFVRTVTLDDGSEGIGIEAQLGHDVPLAKSHQVSGRLVDADGKYISEIVTTVGSDPSTLSLVYPTSVLRRFPDEGETVGVALGWRTSDGAYVPTTLWGTVNYNISQSATITESYERHASDDTWTDYLTMNAHEQDWCWLAIEHGSGVEMFDCPTILSDSGRKTFKVLPPFNKPYRLVLLARDGNSKFALKTVTMPAFEAHVYTWSWSERFDETVNLHVNHESRPKQSREYEADSAVHITTGRRHPVAWAHRTVSIDLSVEGVTYFNDSMRYTQDEDYDKLAYTIGQGQHPVYRTPRGDWYRVAVKGVDNSYQNEWGSEVKVSQEAVTV